MAGEAVNRVGVGGVGEGTTTYFGITVNNNIVIQRHSAPARNMYTANDDTSYTMDGSSSRNAGRGGFAPNRHQARPNPQYGDPNARLPGHRQPVSNLDRSITEPKMNTPYNLQNEQYSIGNAPVFAAANAQPSAYRQPAPNLDRSMEPKMNTPYNLQNEQYSIGNAPVFDAANAQLPTYRQPAPNLGRFNTEPKMNTPYNLQNEQYAVGNAPVFDAANAQPPTYRQPAPNLNRSNTEPTTNTPYNPQNGQYAIGNAPVFGAANAEPPVFRQPATNLDRFNTVPMMKTRYNPQNEQYVVGNAPDFDPDNAPAAYVQRHPNERPIAQPLQPTYSAPPQPHPHSRRGPAQPRPANMVAMPVPSQNNSGGMSYSRDNMGSSPEDAVASSWSSRSKFPQENWSQQTSSNKNQFPPSSHRVRPQARRRREEVGDDPGSDSEDPDPPPSAPPRQPQSHRTSSQVRSSLSAQPPRRPHRHNGLDNDSDSDPDGAAVMSAAPFSRTRQNSSQEPGASTLLASMAAMPVPSQNNSGGMNYSRDNLGSSPEDAVASSWSSRSKFPSSRGLVSTNIFQ
ncbi:hypothetical protein MSAN_01163600 [Mycena sanguinolenta]|uniref:Uncharacterized protein n=1 Tax=Mycena sanguinolenta TaxID=230812 RepID=A0A8H6YN61_9AGAR|nr:hypothetical protein MSAN_01163600 [Mycena sanguinolenta]